MFLINHRHFRKLSELSRNTTHIFSNAISHALLLLIYYHLSFIAEYNSIWHCDLSIKRFVASQCNQIYSEASSTHFSAVNLSYTYALPIIILIDPNKSQTFQKTISVIAEHNSIWHFVIIQSKHFSPLNAIKYILKHLQHTFLLLIYHILRSTHHNPHCS